MSQIDTNTNPLVSLHAAFISFVILNRYTNESNDTYLTCFKSSIETLKLAGRCHIFISELILGKNIASTTDKEFEIEKEIFKAVCVG